MSKIRLAALLVALLALTAVSSEGKNKMEKLYATFDTSMGKIVCELYPEEAPQTVINFVGLAKGIQKWTDPRTSQVVKKSLYEGTIFHRVIPNFMIQGGDPLGTGTGGPGYQFGDEISPKLKFDKVGRLAMANAGPGTNGSQFFITVAATPWLDGHHTIFGQVIKGQDIADQIANVEKDQNDRPRTPVELKAVIISENKP
jgi:peptidyl-prolyl cis-trans isomerase A (cyclophilin A)